MTALPRAPPSPAGGGGKCNIGVAQRCPSEALWPSPHPNTRHQLAEPDETQNQSAPPGAAPCYFKCVWTWPHEACSRHAPPMLPTIHMTHTGMGGTIAARMTLTRKPPRRMLHACQARHGTHACPAPGYGPSLGCARCGRLSGPRHEATWIIANLHELVCQAPGPSPNVGFRAANLLCWIWRSILQGPQHNL